MSGSFIVAYSVPYPILVEASCNRKAQRKVEVVQTSTHLVCAGDWCKFASKPS